MRKLKARKPKRKVYYGFGVAVNTRIRVSIQVNILEPKMLI